MIDLHVSSIHGNRQEQDEETTDHDKFVGIAQPVQNPDPGLKYRLPDVFHPVVLSRRFSRFMVSVPFPLRFRLRVGCSPIHHDIVGGD
jgi:hypothetical protein